MAKARATREDIFKRMTACMGQAAVDALRQAMIDMKAKQYDSADQIIANLDEQIGGGFGVFVYYKDVPRLKHSGHEFQIKRPFYYIHGHLNSRDPFRWGRTIVRDIGFHIEGVAKQFVKINFPNNLILLRKPLGSILHNRGFCKVVPPDLVEQLRWFNNFTYAPAKHDIKPFEGAVAEDDPQARLFELDEAMAVYFIARVAGLKLMGVGGFRPKIQ